MLYFSVLEWKPNTDHDFTLCSEKHSPNIVLVITLK